MAQKLLTTVVHAIDTGIFIFLTEMHKMKINKNFIGGKWVLGEKYIDNINPSDINDNIGFYTQADIDQLELALDTAKTAQKQWAKVGLEKRYDILSKIGHELINESSRIGTILSREEGKTLAEGKGEVYRSGQFFTYYAAEVLRQKGETFASVRENIDIGIYREPLGVVAVISPWNFPMATAAWKIAPALAFGNSVLWKPANLTPASAIALTEIIAKQNVPEGLFQLIMGSGSELGDALVRNPKVDGISFTGSLDVGQKILVEASKNMTKIQMEMGSKNALVVSEDADIDIAVDASVIGAFGGTGQKCTASSRIVVDERVYDEFVEKFVSATSDLRVGNALCEDTQIGPVVSQTQLQSNLDYIKLGVYEGAELACGGKQLSLLSDGYYQSPAVFLKTNNTMQINREEMFAPIACVMKSGSHDESLAIVNDTSFGLMSGIITKSLARAEHFRKEAKTGCVMVNLPTAGTDYHVPFGGRGSSSFGSREQGQYAQEFYTSLKTVYKFSGVAES